MGFFSNVFKSPGKGELKEKIQNGALLLDVRSREEYDSGHAERSVNIPLDILPDGMAALSKDVPVIAVCQSGARSAYAVDFLKRQGFEAYNGGGWQSFQKI